MNFETYNLSQTLKEIIYNFYKNFQFILGCASYHTIKAGETFSKLADYYHASAESIQRANPTVNSSSLQIGQTVCIPSNGGAGNNGANNGGNNGANNGGNNGANNGGNYGNNGNNQ